MIERSTYVGERGERERGEEHIGEQGRGEKHIRERKGEGRGAHGRERSTWEREEHMGERGAHGREKGDRRRKDHTRERGEEHTREGSGDRLATLTALDSPKSSRASAEEDVEVATEDAELVDAELVETDLPEEGERLGEGEGLGRVLAQACNSASFFAYSETLYNRHSDHLQDTMEVRNMGQRRGKFEKPLFWP